MLAMASHINRCPLLGSTPWRHQIKLHDIFFPVVAKVPASGRPADPGTRQGGGGVCCCLGGSLPHADFGPRLKDVRE